MHEGGFGRGKSQLRVVLRPRLQSLAPAPLLPVSLAPSRSLQWAHWFSLIVFVFDGFIVVVLFSELLYITFTQKTKQVCILEKLNCPYVVAMYGFFGDSKHLYIVLELMRGGELFHELQKKVGASRYFVFPRNNLS